MIKEQVIHKHDTSEHWNLAKNFIPKAGEVIIYDDINKIKIGDGVRKLASLNFILNNIPVFNGERD